MSSYVRLRGLPFQATEQDVTQWFACTPGGPMSTNRVLFTYNNAGRKSGEAVRARVAPRLQRTSVPRPAPTPASPLALQFVELGEFLAERAVQLLHNRNMQNRYIEVFVSSEAEASQANVAPPVSMQVPMHLQMADMRLAAASGSAPAWAEGGASMVT